MKNIAIFASGGGTNAERVIKQFKDSIDVHVAVVLTNNPKAGGIERADAQDVPVEVIESNYGNPSELLRVLEAYDIDIVLLMGYLKLLPQEVITKYQGHILNQHPALLPKYGGKGMYGRKVHEAVAASNDSESGFSLHRATAKYDDGEVVYQAKVQIPGGSDADKVEELVLALELTKVASAIEELIKNQKI